MTRQVLVTGAGRFLFSSTACVYPQHKQHEADVTPLKEEDAWPADPEPGYGLETRVVRFQNVYGPLGTYTRIRARSTRPLRSVFGARKRESGRTWAPEELATTTRCVRASPPPSSASCWMGGVFVPRLKRRWLSSNSSKASTIRVAATRDWARWPPQLREEASRGGVKTSMPACPPKRGNCSLIRANMLESELEARC